MNVIRTVTMDADVDVEVDLEEFLDEEIIGFFKDNKNNKDRQGLIREIRTILDDNDLLRLVEDLLSFTKWNNKAYAKEWFEGLDFSKDLIKWVLKNYGSNVEEDDEMKKKKKTRLGKMELSIVKVFEWSIARQIDVNSSVSVQLCKLFEEFFEYQAANTMAEERDAIGDMFIVALNLFAVSINKGKRQMSARQLYQTLESERPENTFEDTFDSIGDLVKFFNRKLIRDQIKPSLLIYALIGFFGDRLESGLSSAWKEIKDRKGHLTPDGNFVKEDDK